MCNNPYPEYQINQSQQSCFKNSELSFHQRCAGIFFVTDNLYNTKCLIHHLLSLHKTTKCYCSYKFIHTISFLIGIFKAYALCCSLALIITCTSCIMQNNRSLSDTNTLPFEASFWILIWQVCLSFKYVYLSQCLKFLMSPQMQCSY